MGIFDTYKNISGFNMLNSFLHPERGYQDAAKQAEKYYQQGQGYLDPYNQHGQEQYGDLNTARQSLMNPQELANKWAEGYQESPYAKRMEQMNLQQGQEAASSMGLMGSSGALQNIQQGAGDIVARDRREYLNDLMQKYMAGIGLGQSLYGTGANAAGAMSNNAMTQGGNMAGLTYGATNAPGSLFGRLLGAGAGAAANYFMPGAGGAAGAAGGMSQGANMFNQ